MGRDHAGEPRRWLLLIYRVPQEPAGRRTYVWRALKAPGAVYLQQAAAILPDRPELRRELEALAARIREYGGEVSLLETTSPDAGWDAETIGRFNRARGEEYAELVENVERLEDEIARESRKGKYTFAEMEDIESDWEKLVRWQERIVARDFFGSPSAAAAEEAVGRARTALEGFRAIVYEREGAERPPDAAGGASG